MIFFTDFTEKTFRQNRLIFETAETPARIDAPKDSSDKIPSTTTEGPEDRKTLQTAIDLNSRLENSASSYYQAILKTEDKEVQAKATQLRLKAESEDVSYYDLQGGWEWMGLSEENHEQKYTLLSQAYLNKGTNEYGQTVFVVKKELDNTEKTKYSLGAGHLLPPSIKAVEITDLEGNKRTGIRKSMNGRTGYYDDSYIPIFGGYTIRPLEFIDEKTDSYTKALDEEKNFYKENKALAENEEEHRSIHQNIAQNVGITGTLDPNDERYTKKITRKDIPPRVPENEMYVQKMPYMEGLDYYRNLCGNNINEWLLKGKFSVFGTTVWRPNIVLACVLKELEYRMINKGFNFKFDYLTSTNVKPIPRYHAMGLGIDFDPKTNWLNSLPDLSWDIPLVLAVEAQKMGMGWGLYYYSSRKDKKTDPMHFSLQASLPDVINQLTSPEAIALAQNFQVPKKSTSLYAYGKRLGGDSAYA